jgi:hypothetical protein
MVDHDNASLAALTIVMATMEPTYLFRASQCKPVENKPWRKVPTGALLVRHSST